MHDAQSQVLYELSVEMMVAILKNPNINFADPNIAVVAVNHAERLMTAIDTRIQQGLN